MKITSKDEFDVLSKRVEILENKLNKSKVKVQVKKRKKTR
jgi:hypothetical protein